jgi:site-specific recombinase XerC
MCPLRSFKIKSLKDAFLIARGKQGLSTRRTESFRKQLDDFEKFASAHNIGVISEVTTDFIRAYVYHLHDKGYTKQVLDIKLQPIRAFLKWYGKQAKGAGWQNPIKQIKLPTDTSASVRDAIIKDIEAIIATCKSDFEGTRDKAIMLCLLDTGTGKKEFMNINLVDVDLNKRTIVIRKEKSGQLQSVAIRRETIQALRDYLRLRTYESPPALWLTKGGHRLKAHSLPSMLAQRGRMAGIHPPSIRDFKRASKQNNQIT